MMLGPGNVLANRIPKYFVKGDSVVEIWCELALSKQQHWTLNRSAIGALQDSGWQQTSAAASIGKTRRAVIYADVEIEYAYASNKGAFQMRKETMTPALQIELLVRGIQTTLFMPYDEESANPKWLANLIGSIE